MRRVVLVTGGSSGIGAAICRLAARDGWDVALSYTGNRAGAEATVRAVEEAGGRALAFHADLCEPGGPAALFEAFDEGYDRLDALVNNAGVVDVAARVDEMPPSRLQRMFAINTIAPFLCSALAVRRMTTLLGGPGGVIVNISSVAARLGSARQFVDYAASKAAIDTLTRGLAEEVATEGIRVAAVRPGLIETGIHGRGGDPYRAARLAPQVPMARAGGAEEVAEAVLWLMSDKASYVTGTTLDVSGGR